MPTTCFSSSWAMRKLGKSRKSGFMFAAFIICSTRKSVRARAGGSGNERSSSKQRVGIECIGAATSCQDRGRASTLVISA